MSDDCKAVAGSVAHEGPPAPLWRRVAALFYDGLFVIAVLMLATFILLPFLNNKAMPPIPTSGIWHWLYLLYLLAWVTAYFSLFWCIGGQTPGMKVWHIAVRLPGDRIACLPRAMLRFVGGIVSLMLGGLPFWWGVTDPRRRSLIDRWLGTVVIRR